MELPGPRPAERADARRNRARVLAAASGLLDERGLDGVTMAAVARAAGVSRNTVLNRFGDRAGLARALVDEPELRLQDALLRGPPPLGPGAPARRRLHAFLDALADLTDAHRALLLEVDGGRPAGRYETGAYAAWRLHVGVLLAEAVGEGAAPAEAGGEGAAARPAASATSPRAPTCCSRRWRPTSSTTGGCARAARSPH